MWSEYYLYFYIRSDSHYRSVLSTEIVVKVLESTAVLKKQGPQSFVNNSEFPWIDMFCVNSDNGSYSHNFSDTTEFCNLIVVLCAKGDHSDNKKCLDLLMQVANALNWELVLEEDDKENEDVILN